MTMRELFTLFVINGWDLDSELFLEFPPAKRGRPSQLDLAKAAQTREGITIIAEA